MQQFKAIDRLSLMLAILCVLDSLLGIILLYKLELTRSGSSDDGLQITFYYEKDEWTIFRPFLFALLWGISLSGIRVGQLTGKILTGLGLMMGLLYYLVRMSWSNVTAIYQHYQYPESEKPLLFNLYGWNEWDLIRLALLMVLGLWWGRRITRKKSLVTI